VQTDSLFYWLFQTAPSLLFELIGVPIPLSTSYEFRSVEVKQTAFRLDGVFWPNAITAETPVYIVEVQFQRDEQLYARLFTEVMTFLRQNPTVRYWHVVVMYGSRACEPRDVGAYEPFVALPQFQRVYLDEVAETERESMELGLVRLIVEPPQQAIARAQQLVERAAETPSLLSASVIIEMIETIIVYKFPNLSWQEVEAMFGLSELKQTRVYQQGREEGKEEGREEGRESEARLVLRLLTRRLGELPESIIQQVNALSIESLEVLGEALLDFSSMDDLQQWFTDDRQRHIQQE
jgi:predicted transposase/invertase (TIGR01784 family)